MEARPCPFCGAIPKFRGEPIDRSNGCYYVHFLPCGCHSIEVFCGSNMQLRNWGFKFNEEEMVEKTVKNWNESFFDYE